MLYPIFHDNKMDFSNAFPYFNFEFYVRKIDVSEY
jgi:hypothetical protein